MKFTIYQDSRQGTRRDNQDRVAHAYSRDALLMVVADGMGGHAHGELAAQLAARALIENFRAAAAPRIARPAVFLEDALHRAHALINDYASCHHLPDTPHTTCVVALVQDGVATWAHTGDSRLYFIRESELVARTQDHSAVAQLVREGLLDATQTATHPERNKVTNCLGGFIPPEVDISPAHLLDDGDILLLCTDGVWGPLADAELVALLEAQPLDQATLTLMSEAERRSGLNCDNLSLIALRWGEAREPGLDTVSTLALPVDGVTTQIELLRELPAETPQSDDEIERAIEDIQRAIQKVSAKK